MEGPLHAEKQAAAVLSPPVGLAFAGNTRAPANNGTGSEQTAGWRIYPEISLRYPAEVQ